MKTYYIDEGYLTTVPNPKGGKVAEVYLKEDVDDLIQRIKETDYYHKIGKVEIWIAGNDAVVDMTQEAIIKDLSSEEEKK